MARKSTKQALQPTHEQDGQPVGEPVPVGEVVDQVLGRATEFEPANETPQPVLDTVAEATHGQGKHRRQEHAKLTIPAGEALVHFIDKGDNQAGIGVRVSFPEGRLPTDEEKEIIRSHLKSEEGGRPSGFSWKPQMGMWHKDIGDDSPPSRAIAIRMDAERRVKNIAEDLSRLHDPAGFADKEQHRQEQGQGADPIPF